MARLSLNTKLDSLITKILPQKSQLAKNDLFNFNKYCAKIPKCLEDNIKTVFDNNKFRPTKVQNEILKMVRHIERKQPIIEKKELRIKIKDTIQKSTQETKDTAIQQSNLRKKIADNLKKDIYNWQPLNFDDQSALQYAAGKLAPNYATIHRVFNEIKARRPEFQPKTILDFGSGLGTVSWAAQNIWPSSLRHHYCVDNNESMQNLAKQLILGSDYSINFPRQSHYFSNCLPPNNSAPFDLVICAYSLLEMPGRAVSHILIDQLLSHTKHFLIFIEHGTTSSYNVIMDARDYVLRKRKEAINNPVNDIDNINSIKIPSLFAPCPHDTECLRSRSQHLSQTPCSFRVKFNPLKVTQPKLDNAFTESYSYVVFEMTQSSDQAVSDNDYDEMSRVVAPPLIRHKHVHCYLCTKSGALTKPVISKNQYGGEVYRYAKKCQAGSYFPWPLKKLTREDSEMDEEEKNC